MIESIARYSKLITRAIISVPSSEDRIEEANLPIPTQYRHFYQPSHLWKMSINHAVGLHKAIEMADTEYIMICDPDIFFCMPGFDQFYLDTFLDNNLSIIGIEHYQTGHAIEDFPTIINCLVRRMDLPGPDMFHGQVHYLRRCWEAGCDEVGEYPMAPDNYFLLCGCMPRHFRTYPAPLGYYDTGSKLYVWNELRGGRWLSFGPGKGYALAENHHCNFESPIVNKVGKILYHQSRVRNIDVANEFRREYVKSLNPTLI